MSLFKTKPTTKFVNIPVDSSYYKTHGVLQIFLAVTFYFVTRGSSMTPPTVGMTGCLLMLCLGMRTLSRHLDIQSSLRQLSQVNIFKTSIEWIRSHRPDMTTWYLGKGFLWDVESAQKYYQLVNMPNLREIVDLEPEGGGKLFLHNIGIENEVDRFVNLREHSMIAGETGVGKSQLILLLATQMIEKGEAVIIVDPKGDRSLLDGIYRACVQHGRKDDFQFFSLVHPNNSGTLDPFANCLRANDIADRVRSLMTAAGAADTTDPFVNFCWGLVHATADLMLTCKVKVTPKSLYRYVVTARNELNEIGKRRLDECTNPAEERYLKESLAHFESRVMSYDSTHQEKMSASLIPILTVLGRGEVGNMLSPNVASIQVPDVIKNRRVLYLFLSAMTDGFTAASVGKLMVQDIIGYVGQEYAYNTEIHGLNIIVDEFYSVAFPGYVELLNKSRAAGVRLTLAMQTSADIASIMGETVAAQVIGNTNNYIVLRIPEQYFAKLIAEKSGEINVPQLVKTRSINAGMDRADHLFKSGSSERMDTATVPLISPEQLMALPRGEAFLISEGKIIKIRIPLLENTNEDIESFFGLLNPDNKLGQVETDYGDPDYYDDFGIPVWNLPVGPDNTQQF